MDLPILAAGELYNILGILVWAVLGLLNYWVWAKSKAQGNLLMLVGAAANVLAQLIILFSTFPDTFVWFWLPWIGLVVFTFGFYLTVKPMVAAQIEAMRKKAANIGKAAAGDDANPQP